jgi:hypothetical protein
MVVLKVNLLSWLGAAAAAAALRAAKSAAGLLARGRGQLPPQHAEPLRAELQLPALRPRLQQRSAGAA